MKINGIVERKILILEGKLKEIEDWNIKDFAGFKNSSLHINAVERALTVCVEIIIDITARLLALNEVPPKDTSVEKLDQIEELDCIKSAEYYYEMVKFRNLVIHRYENIDPGILFSIISNDLGKYRKFIHEIRTYCTKH